MLISDSNKDRADFVHTLTRGKEKNGFGSRRSFARAASSFASAGREIKVHLGPVLSQSRLPHMTALRAQGPAPFW